MCAGRRVLVSLVFCFVVLLPGSGRCTETYASETGKSCEACHLDPSGGGPLTDGGRAFRQGLIQTKSYRPLSRAQRVARLLIGYLHTLTAILWFGTILYVHLLLRPAYAARGLPRGELMLGWVSMAVMAVTGGLLSMARLASWEMLFHTRFGILLLIKIVLFLILVASATVVTFVIGPKLKRRAAAEPDSGAGPMTADALAACDGREGRPTYIAYAGKVYDVSNSPLWKGGRHMGKHPAAAELTPFLAQAPHGEEKILAMREVADFRPDVAAGTRLEVRVFFLLAYLNLVPVFSSSLSLPSGVGGETRGGRSARRLPPSACSGKMGPLSGYSVRNTNDERNHPTGVILSPRRKEVHHETGSDYCRRQI